MGDLALRWSSDDLAADLAIEANALATDAGLETAVMLSLFTDRRAEEGDTLPESETDRRGWWADSVPVVEGDRFGARLWLLDREKASQSALNRAEEYAREALQWILDDAVAERIDVTAEMPRAGVLGLTVTIWRPHQDPVRYQFSHVWSAMEA